MSNEKQNDKIVDTIKTYFSDEKKMTDADAKNSGIVIEGRKKIADAYVELALDKDTPSEDKEHLLRKASAEIDKAQSESTEVRTSNERRSNRKLCALWSLAGVGIGYAAPKVYRLAKDELPKLLPGIKK